MASSRQRRRWRSKVPKPVRRVAALVIPRVRPPSLKPRIGPGDRLVSSLIRVSKDRTERRSKRRAKLPPKFRSTRTPRRVQRSQSVRVRTTSLTDDTPRRKRNVPPGCIKRPDARKAAQARWRRHYGGSGAKDPQPWSFRRFC